MGPRRAVVALLSIILVGLPAAHAGASPSVAPDLSIATRNYRFVGNGIVQPTGKGERVDQEVPPGRTRSFEIRISNPSQETESFRIRGRDSNGAFTAAYVDRGQDVTGDVVGGTYEVTMHAGGVRYLALEVTAGAEAPTGTSAVFKVRGENAADAQLADAVRAGVTVPPLRTWAVNYKGTLRCTASFPLRTLRPGYPTKVRFTVTNLEERALRSRVYEGYLVFRDANGNRLWGTSPRFSRPAPPPLTLGPHQTKKLYSFDARIRWSGPLSVTPVCEGLGVAVPTVQLDVEQPSDVVSTAEAIDRAVAVPGSPFQVCHPGPNGEARTGTFDAPNGAKYPPLTLRCWAEVRQEQGFHVVSLQLVSPQDAPDYTIDEDGSAYGSLPGTGSMLAARWSFVVSEDTVRPYITLMVGRVEGMGRAHEFILKNGTWTDGGWGRCPFESLAASYNGTWFFLDWITNCS
jgi:hypothetical protein